MGMLRAVSAPPERGVDGEGRHPLHPLWKAGGLCGPSRLDGDVRSFRIKNAGRSLPEPPAAYRVKQKRRPLPFESHRRIVHPLICHNEEAPLQVSSQPCNSTALAPRKPLCPNGFHVHDLPSQKFPSNGGVTPAAYAASVISLRSQCRPRWVSDPKFLLSCCLTMSRRCNKQPRGVPELDLSNFSRSPDAVFFRPSRLVKTSKTQQLSVYRSLFTLSISACRRSAENHGISGLCGRVTAPRSPPPTSAHSPRTAAWSWTAPSCP